MEKFYKIFENIFALALFVTILLGLALIVTQLFGAATMNGGLMIAVKNALEGIATAMSAFCALLSFVYLYTNKKRKITADDEE